MPSRCCWSSATPTRTRRGPIAAPPPASGPRRPRSPSSCVPAACASCGASAPGSSRACASCWRPARSRSWPSSSASSHPDLVGLGRYLGLTANRARRAGASAGRAHRRAVPRGGGRRPPARRPRDRPQDRGATAGGARPRGGAPAPAGPAARPRDRSGGGHRVGARRTGRRRRAPATRPVRAPVRRLRGDGGRRRARSVRRRCRRSSRWSSARIGALSG